MLSFRNPECIRSDRKSQTAFYRRTLHCDTNDEKFCTLRKFFCWFYGHKNREKSQKVTLAICGMCRRSLSSTFRTVGTSPLRQLGLNSAPRSDRLVDFTAENSEVQKVPRRLTVSGALATASLLHSCLPDKQLCASAPLREKIASGIDNLVPAAGRAGSSSPSAVKADQYDYTRS